MPDEVKPIYRDIVLKTIREKEWKDGKGFGCWIVQTVKDEKSWKVQVRAGMYKPNKVTGEKSLPLDGLELGDLTSLTLEWEEIKALLSIPKGTAVDPRTTDNVPEPETERMPWE